MNRYRWLGVLMALALLLSTVSVAAAQEGNTDDPAPAESTTTLSGTVIAVDEEAGTVTLLTEDGEEVVIAMSLGDYDHPIVALLAAYFGGPDLGDYADALDALEVEIAQDDGTTVSGTVVEVVEVTDAQGNTTWEVTVEGEDGTTTTVTIDDAQLAEDLLDALDTLDATLEVTEGEEGEFVASEVGDDIEAYHEDGMGFGVLVMLYSIADQSQAACEAEAAEEGAQTGDTTDEETVEEPCGVTVEELVELFNSGVGMGQLFQEYGRPALLGIGHVRQEMRDQQNVAQDDEAGEENGARGVCNARSHGGNANANGRDVECP